MFSAIRNFFSPRGRLITTLRGHSGPVMSIDISRNGKFLAAGGEDGLKIWDLSTRKQLKMPQQPYQERSQVSSVRWVTRRNETVEVVCYGNALGYLVFLQHRPSEGRFEAILSVRIARGGEILCMTTVENGTTTRLATGTRDKCVQVWLFDSEVRQLAPVYSKTYGQDREVVPKSLAFDTNAEKDLFVFGLYDGGLYKYGGNDSRSISKHQLGSQIGNATADVDRQICVIDNTATGFDLYKMDNGSFVRTLETKKAKKTYPRGVAFADSSRLVVGGSDHGRVYVFERKTGRVLGKLKHARKGGVETIAVHDSEAGHVLIASASATTSNKSNPILLWQWTTTTTSDDSEWTTTAVLYVIVKALIICAAMAYFVGLIKDLTGGGGSFMASMKGEKIDNGIGGASRPKSNSGGRWVGKWSDL